MLVSEIKSIRCGVPLTGTSIKTTTPFDMQHWHGYKARQHIAAQRVARSVFLSWLPVFRARCALLQARRVARHREAAAVIIQQAARRLKHRRAYQRGVLAVIRLQALWRGRSVRSKSSRKVLLQSVILFEKVTFYIFWMF